jgi:hypothetical protein
LLARFEKKHGKGQALTLLAHPLARAVSDRLQRQTAFALDTCLPGEGRGVGERTAALDSHGMHGLRNARYGGHHGVAARAEASRSLSLRHGFAETSTPAPVGTETDVSRGAAGTRCLASTPG